MPNPIAYLRLADEVALGWMEIAKHFSQSDLSASRPLLRGTMGRASGPMTRYSNLPRLRLSKRRQGRYIVFADIAECYRTIYTHSIPWALHTKGIARTKANLNNTALLGNRIDRALQDTQERQTNGIPIGPDTSFVIGEIILGAVDQHFLRECSPLAGFRYYDDYELVFNRYSEAEEGLAALHAATAEYNLQLHSTKTRIVELPVPLDSSWREPLRGYKFEGTNEQATERALLGYFDLAIALKNDNPTDAVIGYAISRLESVLFSGTAWDVFRDFLLHAMRVEPASIQQVAVALAQAHARRDVLELDALSQTLTHLIAERAIQGHGYEVAWALWIALSFGCVIDDRAALHGLQGMGDSVVALLALDALHRKLITGLDTTYWSTLMTSAELNGAHWLLAYEARVRGWLPSLDGGDHVAATPGFAFLASHGVRFYRQVRAPTRRQIHRIPNWRPAYGDEDELDDRPEIDDDESVNVDDDGLL